LTPSKSDVRAAAKLAGRRKNATRQARIDQLKAEHYKTLGQINTELEQKLAEIRQRAQDARRKQYAAYRTALEKERAA
jgi:hypothetical protein